MITAFIENFVFLRAGMGSLAHFSDSGESSNQEEEYESEGGDSEEHEGEDLGTLDEQLERRTNATGMIEFSSLRLLKVIRGVHSLLS